MTSSRVKDITDDTFEPEVLASPIAVLVDYWAEKCIPCKAISAMLDEIAESFEGRLKMTKLNVDHNPNVPAKFGVRGVPTLMLFKDGNLKATRLGGLSKAQLTTFLAKNM